MPALLSALEPAARITVATLFNSLWESAVLAIVVALVLRFVPNVNATTRYAAWCVALAGSLLLPLATALPQIAVQKPPIHAPVVSAPHHTIGTKSSAHKPVQAPSVQAAPAVKTAPTPSFRLPERLHFALPQWLALAIFAVWCAAAVLLLVRLALNLWKLERLKSDALPLPVEYRERLERWASADKGEREVRLCVCESIEVPVAVGLFDSMILIPRHLLESLSQNEVDQIILHELAHLRRADDWTNGLQRLIQALFFFNPAVLYIAQQLDVEREVACDDWVVNQTKEVRPYATCLTKMAEATAWPHRPLAAPGVFITRRGLSVRVERLLRAGRDARIGIAFGPTGAIAAALIVLFFVLQNVAPSFAFTLPQDTKDTVIVSKHEAVKAKAGVVKRVALATPAPQPSSSKVITVPAQHIHIPARTVHIPEVNVDVPARRIAVPPAPRVAYEPKVHVVPEIPNASKSVSETIAKTMSQAMAPLSHDTMNCVGCDYSGQNLSGHSFRGQKLSGADFSRANLRNADFSDTVLVGADFSRADLRGANFSNAKLTGCDFSHANIDGINFSGVSMVGCDVDARSLPPAQAAALLRGCRTGCDFSYANLSGQSLSGIELTGIDLSHADLRNADLSNVRFQGVDFRGARLDGARLNGAEFTGCDFSGVDLHNVDFSSARITGSKMSADH